MKEIVMPRRNDMMEKLALSTYVSWTMFKALADTRSDFSFQFTHLFFGNKASAAVLRGLNQEMVGFDT